MLRGKGEHSTKAERQAFGCAKRLARALFYPPLHPFAPILGIRPFRPPKNPYKAVLSYELRRHETPRLDTFRQKKRQKTVSYSLFWGFPEYPFRSRQSAMLWLWNSSDAWHFFALWGILRIEFGVRNYFPNKQDEMNRAFQSVVFNSGQMMALRAFYFIRALTNALTYYYINRSQRHLLAAIYWKLLIGSPYYTETIHSIVLSYFGDAIRCAIWAENRHNRAA